MSIEEYLERLGDHGPHGFMYDPEGRELALREIVQSALAERTEQCAKVLQDRMDYLKSFDYKERITTTRGDASTIYNELNAALFKIRALNQPEKNNAQNIHPD